MHHRMVATSDQTTFENMTPHGVLHAWKRKLHEAFERALDSDQARELRESWDRGTS